MVVGRVLQIVAHRRSKCIVKPSVPEKSVVKGRKSLMVGVVQYRYHCSDNGYSDILDIVILLSLSIFLHLHIRHTKFIGYTVDSA